MERRQSPRQPMQRNAAVYSYGVLVAVGATADISEQGAYIRFKDDVSGGALAPGAAARIVFSEQESSHALQETPAKIVRQGPDGVGLIFLEPGNVDA